MAVASYCYYEKVCRMMFTFIEKKQTNYFSGKIDVTNLMKILSIIFKVLFLV